jgi:hypothetical protein
MLRVLKYLPFSRTEKTIGHVDFGGSVTPAVRLPIALGG